MWIAPGSWLSIGTSRSTTDFATPRSRIGTSVSPTSPDGLKHFQTSRATRNTFFQTFHNRVAFARNWLCGHLIAYSLTGTEVSLYLANTSLNDNFKCTLSLLNCFLQALAEEALTTTIAFSATLCLRITVEARRLDWYLLKFCGLIPRRRNRKSCDSSNRSSS